VAIVALQDRLLDDRTPATDETASAFLPFLMIPSGWSPALIIGF